MTGRILLPFFALCPLLLAGTGCSRGQAKPAPVIVNQIRPAEVARNDLFHIARKIEDPASFQQIEFYVKSFEDPAKGWTWSDLDEYIHGGNYSIQTRVAYDNYRRLKILESKR